MTLDDLDDLRPERNPGYLAKRIPDPLDSEIASLVDTAREAGGWADLRARVGQEHESLFRLFAERMASEAVRLGNVEPLEQALIALAAGGLERDSREAMLIVPLVYRSAELLGEDPARLFEEVAALLGGPTADTLRGFLQRPDRSIGAMGYIESNDEDGFRYRRTW